MLGDDPPTASGWCAEGGSNGVNAMRWKTVAVWLALAGTLAGCKQQCFLNEGDYEHYTKDLNLPATLPTDPAASTKPLSRAGDVPLPTTVNNPALPIHYLSLAEAVAMALEHGTVGSQSVIQPGFPNDNLVSFAGRTVFGSDSIRVLALDPAVVGADIEASLAKFDARFIGQLNWTTTDQPVGTPLQTLETQGNAAIQAVRTQDAFLSMAMLKPLPSGGVAGMTFRTDYEFTNLPNRLNPSYRPNLQFQFEQPLLQGFGVEINQLRAAHPGSLLTPFNTGGRVEGILITRIRFDQQRAEFERNVHQMLLNVEVAYWNLYSAYGNLYSRELGLRAAHFLWSYIAGRFKVPGTSTADLELTQARGQYELFRSERLQALDNVLEQERRLRSLLGLPAEDGYRLVPADAPTLAAVNPDWELAKQETLGLRPELIIAREDLKFRQLDIISAQNLTLPDLRFTATYDANAVGTRVDGFGTDNALRQLASNHFNDWAAGFRYEHILGYRDARAQLRQARLNLARAARVLEDQEDKSIRYLQLQYRTLASSYAQIQANQEQRLWYGQYAQVSLTRFLQSGQQVVQPTSVLEAQRFFTTALANEYQFIGQYNNALASWEFAKGTIMQHDNIIIGEGPLPKCAQVRAVDHERQRTAALVFHERVKAPEFQPCATAVESGSAAAEPATQEQPKPFWSKFSGLMRKESVARSLPALLQKKEEEKLELLDDAGVGAAGLPGAPLTSGAKGSIIIEELPPLPGAVSPANSLPTLPDLQAKDAAPQLMPNVAPAAPPALRTIEKPPPFVPAATLTTPELSMPTVPEPVKPAASNTTAVQTPAATDAKAVPKSPDAGKTLSFEKPAVLTFQKLPTLTFEKPAQSPVNEVPGSDK
jgi:outer membrane protein TolC